jgi:hypothetical protein
MLDAQIAQRRRGRVQSLGRSAQVREVVRTQSAAQQTGKACRKRLIHKDLIVRLLKGRKSAPIF